MHIPAYICDAVRTPFGAYQGLLSRLRGDELAALPLMALMVRNPHIDWEQLSDVIYGCAAQEGEAGHNLARVASMLAGLPPAVPGASINRLCGSGLDAAGSAARAIKSGEAEIMIAGGAESMSRSRQLGMLSDLGSSGAGSTAAAASGMPNLTDADLATPVFSSQLMQTRYAAAVSGLSAEKLAREFEIDRRMQDRYAYASLRKAYAAQQNAYFDAEIVPVTITGKDGDPLVVTKDECIYRPSNATLAGLDALAEADGTVTAGNSAGAGDGACALLLACEKMAYKFSLLPKARVLGMAVAGVPPELMGIGAAIAARKLLVQSKLSMDEMDVIELDESSAAQAVAVLRDWGLTDDDRRVNPNGGAIAFGHPMGATGARLVSTALYQLHRAKGRYGLCAMGVGAGQGIALLIERV